MFLVFVSLAVLVLSACVMRVSLGRAMFEVRGWSRSGNFSSNLDHNGLRDLHFECHRNVPLEAPWRPFGRLDEPIGSLWELLESTLELLGGLGELSGHLWRGPGRLGGSKSHVGDAKSAKVKSLKYSCVLCNI